MHLETTPQYNSALGPIFGLVAALVKPSIVLMEQSTLSWQSVFDTLIIGALGALSGFVVTALLKWCRFQLALLTKKIQEMKLDEGDSR